MLPLLTLTSLSKIMLDTETLRLSKLLVPLWRLPCAEERGGENVVGGDVLELFGVNEVTGPLTCRSIEPLPLLVKVCVLLSVLIPSDA